MIAMIQNSTMTVRNGSWRPAIWPISNASRPVTCPATMIGMPIAPNATGAVLTIRHRPAAYSGETQPDQQCCGDRHWRTETGRPFQEGTEREADHQHLQALVFGHRQDRSADDVELPGLDRDLVEEHRADDDPGDRPQAVDEAEAGRTQRLGNGMR